jgi:hypothetical protein
VVVAASRAIRSPQLQPISAATHREACGSGVVFEDFVWLWGSSDRQETSSATHPASSSPDGCDLFDPFGDFPFATNNVRPTQVGATAHHRHGLEVEYEGLLTDLFLIFIFLRLFCIVQCFFNVTVLF